MVIAQMVQFPLFSVIASRDVHVLLDDNEYKTYD